MPYHEAPEESHGVLHEVGTFFLALALVIVVGAVMALIMFTVGEAGEQILKALSSALP